MTVFYFKAPAIVTGVNTTNFVEGESVILFCDVFGAPYPSVSWINVTNMEKVNDGAIWRLPNMSRNYHGTYQCRANNTCNMDIKEIDIVVKCKSKCVLWTQLWPKVDRPSGKFCELLVCYTTVHMHMYCVPLQI